MAQPPRPPVPPRWYRDVWPWLLALAIVALGLVGGYFAYEAFQDDDDEPEAVTVTTTTATSQLTVTFTTAEEPPQPVEVPDVVGLNHVEAGAKIESLGLVADSYPVASAEARGTVVAQRPPPGASLREGETVRTNVSIGGGPLPRRDVPDVVGPTASNARDALRRAGFTVRTQYREPPSPEEDGEVLAQGPSPGTTASDLSQVTIFVGR